MENIVYWRDDTNDGTTHDSAECPELRHAPLIRKGTREEARRIGRSKRCPYCKGGITAPTARRKAEPNKSVAKATKAAPEVTNLAQKKAAPMIQRSTAWMMSIAVAVFTWIGCYGYYDNQYNIGYSAGVEDASQNYDIGFADGEKNAIEKSKKTWYDDGYLTGYSVGYNAGINDYKEAHSGTAFGNYHSNQKNTYQAPATSNSYTVYITATGSKYHSYGCSYLRSSCYAIDINDAVAQGYTACSRCNP